MNQGDNQPEDAVGSNYYKWRQGSIVPEGFVESKGWFDNSGKPFLAIVATHDCDCVAECDSEPYLELLMGRQIGAADGSFSNAKTTRRLHLSIDNVISGLKQVVEIVAEPKTPILKAELAGTEPWSQYRISAENARILRNWLHSRYDRASFPDELMTRLRPVRELIDKITKKATSASAIHGIYVFHDPDGELEDATEPYNLNLAIVYDTAEEGSDEVARTVASEIRRAFELNYKTLDVPRFGLQWTQIELVECEPVSDAEFTFASMLEYKLYRLDYQSLRQQPQVAVPNL